VIKELGPGFRLTLAFTILTGLLYPVAITVLAQLLFADRANGSMVTVNGKPVGSTLIGQGFSKPEYFHPRPSSAGSGYDGGLSAGSNLGPTSAKLLRGTTKMDDKHREVADFDGVSLRVVHYCLENDIPYESSQPLDRFNDADGNLDDARLIKAFNDPKDPLIFKATMPIPSDAVTGSSSGLDPQISPANAEMQAARVARVRGTTPDQIKQLVAEHTNSAGLGFLGEPGVNVLLLNLALDEKFPGRK
jgi:potassium-transporting ATPase KdpC subunit